MNARKQERRRRFAEMARKQKLRDAERLERSNQMQTAEAVVSRGTARKGLREMKGNRRQRRSESMFSQSGRFVVEHFRGGEKIGEYTFKNGITNQGLNDILDVYFDSGDQKTSWYMGLINNSGFSALDATDVYDDIDQAGNGWDTFQDYEDANNGSSTTTRPEWAPDAPSGQSISNTTQAVFDITGSGTVKGIFVVAGQNAQTKGNHAPGTTPPNILWSTALFSGGDVVVAASDQLKVTYTVNAAAS